MKTLGEIRAQLKHTLYRDRAEWTKQGYQPLCAICGEPPRNNRALEMHETFLTRGDVVGNKELKYDIMTRNNCVLVHSECHIYANSDYNKNACAFNILKYEKYSRVRKWLVCVNKRMHGTSASEAIKLIDQVYKEIQLEKEVTK